MKLPLLALTSLLLTQCATLEKPGKGDPVATAQEAKQILQNSAQAHGDPYRTFRKVNVSYDGEWAPLVNRIQPEIVDASFRKSSDETYLTKRRKVTQLHSGPKGQKTVIRTPDTISVSFNGKPNTEALKDKAAALVADAYTIFTFGTSFLNHHATDLSLLESKEMDGIPCHRIQGTLAPGLGISPSDTFIIWTEKTSGLLRRFQFTLDGMPTTQGADVLVDFSDFKTLSNGSVWPTHFIERIVRPIPIKAHEWRLTSISTK